MITLTHKVRNRQCFFPDAKRYPQWSFVPLDDGDWLMSYPPAGHGSVTLHDYTGALVKCGSTSTHAMQREMAQPAVLVFTW